VFQRSNDRYWRQLVLVDLEMLNKLGQKHVQNHCVNVQGEDHRMNQSINVHQQKKVGKGPRE
jgi:hypothetical protein